MLEIIFDVLAIALMPVLFFCGMAPFVWASVKLIDYMHARGLTGWSLLPHMILWFWGLGFSLALVAGWGYVYTSFLR